MRISLCVAVAAFGLACATKKEPKVISTQVIASSDGVLISCNGTNAGRSPARIILPQDADGRLIGRAEIHAVPNIRQTNSNLIAQTRIFDPETRTDRVPDRILIDMTLPSSDTNSAVGQTVVMQEMNGGKNPFPGRIPYTERSKPTQAVGLDRWNPGK